jgi:MoxR-like ATPase
VSRQQTAARGPEFADHFQSVVANIAKAIQGKDDVIALALLCLIAEGHLLIEDVPGVGKTSLAKALAQSIDVTFGRMQFTPDLLPSDVVGVSVWNRAAGEFQFQAGPIFANIVLADEINRASPKTQSALLESMAEGQVTVDGRTYLLDPPFMVIATQNPIEHEGTYPLPEAQLDRFLMRVTVGYPSREAEIEVLDTHGDHDALRDVEAVASAKDVAAMAQAVRDVHLAPSLRGYLVDLADATRRHPAVALGMSPRATLNLQRVARARAAALGREYVVPDDIKAVFEPVVGHRLLLTPEAQLQGTAPSTVLADTLTSVPVPSGRAH